MRRKGLMRIATVRLVGSLVGLQLLIFFNALHSTSNRFSFDVIGSFDLLPLQPLLPPLLLPRLEHRIRDHSSFLHAWHRFISPVSELKDLDQLRSPSNRLKWLYLIVIFQANHRDFSSSCYFLVKVCGSGPRLQGRKIRFDLIKDYTNFILILTWFFLFGFRFRLICNLPFLN